MGGYSWNSEYWRNGPRTGVLRRKGRSIVPW